ncbi:unnamed protein product, partial [Vitis vinifera]
MVEDDHSIPHHKHCGFLSAVLAINPPQTLDSGTRCHIFGDGSEVGFRSENDVILSPVDSKAKTSTGDSGECSRRKRKRGIGLVHGSISVVRQIHALVVHKCVKIVARVVRVCGEARAVVLVDVYLPIELWSGWQFPRSASTAGALFRHLSCDWEERSSVLVNHEEYYKYNDGDNRSLWNLSDCHVLGCKLHCNALDPSKKKLFELHEIFKSLPSVAMKGQPDSSRVKPSDASCQSGIWEVSDDVLINILTALAPMDLVRVSATCHHLRSLAASIMPCMKLKLFPHQHAAVEWMLQRERNAEILPHPLFIDFLTEDGFAFYINTVTGEIVTGMPPLIRDFRGGMFCDEPGLGKTITALSLILKTQGTWADPPDGVQVIWCTHNSDQRCGYYELTSDNVRSTDSCPGKVIKSPTTVRSMPATRVVRCTRSLSRVKRNLVYAYEEASGSEKDSEDHSECNETWIQCDACHKWRRLGEPSVADAAAAWFCSMNSDPSYQSCRNVSFFTISGGDHGFHKIFQAFGLVRRVEKGTSRWYYPENLENLVFDLPALRIALCEPLDSFRLYLSRATLLRVYVWTDHKKPCAHNLAWDYDVVITTFNRLSAEWRPHKRSVLMQVHWLRVMLDEGHTLGSSLNLTNKLQMAVSLIASNRWLLTGTPTPNTPNSQLSHLQPMLKFLHEEGYGQNQKSWEDGILRPFEAEMEEGRSRLLLLLHRCMISARKADLQTIPPCIKKVTFLNFTEEHAKSYNELVVTVRRNILMADWNDPSHVESLLNPKQWKFRISTIKNVRLSCCVAGHIKVTDAGEDIQETMDILVENGLDTISDEYAFIKYNLLYGGACMRCKEWCRLPVITPCRHLLCLDCVALDSEKCTFPGCGNLYEMQSPEILTRPENPNPKWPVPKDLIELQPSYKQDTWDPDWQSTSSSKVTYIVKRLKALQEANRKSGYAMDEDSDIKDIDELVSLSEQNNCNALLQQDYTRLNDETSHISPEKVLIFSQFLEHIHVIEQQLTVAGIKFSGMYSPMHSSNKMKSLSTFQHDADCMALLMDGSAALGLDLSFVTHVFLMEPIWDRSMEEQVISRAHRMGATRPIRVETLAMRGTIEEQMLEFLQDADECRRFLKEEFGKPYSEGVRAHRSLHDFAEKQLSGSS